MMVTNSMSTTTRHDDEETLTKEDYDPPHEYLSYIHNGKFSVHEEKEWERNKERLALKNCISVIETEKRKVKPYDQYDMTGCDSLV
ncbi:hypothetical protein VNO77_23531 [Canavalia gladiata]|uniref:Uncharacterized protein n=1 Tax=Canavalia gladiata TaxID=3824 RepID=A0AAN9L535_CANGL